MQTVNYTILGIIDNKYSCMFYFLQQQFFIGSLAQFQKLLISVFIHDNKTDIYSLNNIQK